MKSNQFAVVGLGYVGLPLALKLSKKFKVIGYDNNLTRVQTLNRGLDVNNEHGRAELKKNKSLIFTSKEKELKNCEVFFITIPTPIDKNKNPDLSLLKKATKLVAKYIKKGSVVVYESTVYPGTTEEICVPLLQKISGLIYNFDFFCSYSPERINPGDKKNTITNIVKVVSGSNLKTLKKISNIYQSVLTRKVYRCESIKVAEAAKIIENVQRDLNISLINEFKIICDKLNINVYSVLKAANTKWNFLNFKPGLVGGHCIGVDPYYLTYKARKIGVNPQVILSGRKVNDTMPNYYAKKFLEQLSQNKIKVNNSKILIMGATFKENISDIRNSKILEVGSKIKSHGAKVFYFDPHIKNLNLTNINMVNELRMKTYDGIILGVSHDYFYKLGKKKIMLCLKNENSVFYDIQNLFNSKN